MSEPVHVVALPWSGFLSFSGDAGLLGTATWVRSEFWAVVNQIGGFCIHASKADYVCTSTHFWSLVSASWGLCDTEFEQNDGIYYSMKMPRRIPLNFHFESSVVEQHQVFSFTYSTRYRPALRESNLNQPSRKWKDSILNSSRAREVTLPRALTIAN